MSKVLLIYPYLQPSNDRSVFRFPPLGVSYLASSLLTAGHEVQIIDCTFMNKPDVLQQALESKAEVVGIYCMVTMLEDCLWLARQLRASNRLLMLGGPLAPCDPYAFVKDFDVVVRGEGERTVLELVQAYTAGGDYSTIKDITYLWKNTIDGKATPDTITN